jgi:hypothetical protein
MHISLQGFHSLISHRNTSPLSINRLLRTSCRFRNLISKRNNQFMTRILIKVLIDILQSSVRRLRVEEVYDWNEEKVECGEDYAWLVERNM